MEMSTISKTTPNANQSSKTNDGLNPVADLPPISTLTPPVTIYGVSPQLYIGQNGSSRSTFAYTTSTLTITTQDNSSFVLDANNTIFNKPLKIYTGLTIPEIQLGASVFNQIVISQQNYFANGYGISLLTPTLSELIIRDDKVLVNRDFEIFKSINGGSIILNLQNDNPYPTERKAVFKYTEIVPTIDDEGAQLEISVPANTRSIPTTPGSFINLLQDKININTGGAKLEVTSSLTYTTNDFMLYKASSNIDLIFQNNTVTAPTERKANVSYYESGNPGEEGGALSLSIPANTRIVPATAGVSVLLVEDTIVLSAKEVQLQGSLLNTNSYLYLNNFTSLSNTQPAPVTWTPTLSFSTPALNSVSYTTQYGLCWQYGNSSYVVFGVVGTITIGTVTNVLITGNLTYPSTTRISDITFNNQSSIASVRFNMSSWSQASQTTPAWLIGLYNMPALNAFTRHEYWQSGLGTNGVAFYGEGFLCHA